MSKLLSVVGLVAICVGFLTLGFGIPYNAFSLGNTLILSGTLLLAAGIVVIGLSAVLAQLHEISLLLQNPAVRAMADSGDVPALAQDAREPADANPHLDRNSEPGEGPAPLNWLRAKSKSGPPSPSMPEPRPLVPPLAEIAADASLPMVRLPKRPRVQRPIGEPAEAMSLDAPVAVKEPDEFQFAWPERPPRMENGTSLQQKDRLVPRNIPPSPLLQRDEKAAETPEPALKQTSGSPKPTLLKAGVIDGMAYRLYSDGSIEAEMPQGPIKFASIDALRLHLEKQD